MAKRISFPADALLLVKGILETEGDIKFKSITSPTEPTLDEDDKFVIWKDSNTSPNPVWIVFRRGAGDQVKIRFDDVNPILDSIQFNTTVSLPPHSPGLVFWDATNQTTSRYTNEPDVLLQDGQELWFLGVNDTGGLISNGQAIYIDGETVLDTIKRPTVALARADASITCDGTIAIATHGVEDGTLGVFTKIGLLRDYNTGSWVAGTILYLSPTVDGGLQDTEPLYPNCSIRMGTVSISDASAGVIDVDISHGADAFQEFLNNTLSTGLLEGGFISDAGGGTIDVSLGTGYIRSTDSAASPVLKISWSLMSGLIIPTDTSRYVVIEYNTGSPQAALRTTDIVNGNTEFRLGVVINESGVLHIIRNPTSVANATTNISHRFYETDPLKRADRLGGLIIGETGTRNITVSAGEIYDSLNEFPISAIDTSISGTFDAYSSAGLESSANTQWDNDNYDNAGTLTSLSPGRYANLWWYIELDNDLVCVYGTAQYTNLATAETEGPPTILPNRLNTHGKLIGRFLIQKGGSVTQSIESIFDTVFTATAVTNHNNLAGINGGAVGEYYHTTAAQHIINTQAATTSLDGYMTQTQATKLDGIEALADVTDAINVNAAGAVMETDFDAQTILAAISDDSPTPITLAVQQLLGRLTGGNVGAIDIGITDNDIMQVDGTITLNDFIKATSGGFVGRDYAETRSDLGLVLARYVFFAEDFLNPVNSDWPVDELAPMDNDNIREDMLVRRFDDITSEGVGFKCWVPVGATDMKLTFNSRSQTTPPGTRTVGVGLYEFGITNNATAETWSSVHTWADLSFPTNTNWQIDTETKTLSSLSITAGKTHQFELVRKTPTGGTNLPYDWAVYKIMVEFI